MVLRWIGIALIIFSVSCAFQCMRLSPATPIIDMGIWAQQAGLVQNGDRMQEFDLRGAYAHPGGTLIEGTIGLHSAFTISYDDALQIFLVIFDSIFVTAACILAYLFYRNFLFSIATLVVVSVQPLIQSSTPPCLLVSFSLLCLLFLTLILYQETEEKQKKLFFVLWGLVAGFSIATRTDIGTVLTVAFGVLLSTKYSLKTILLLALGTFASFVLFDPYMWFMPIQHMHDLVAKMVLHYAEFPVPLALDYQTVFFFSIRALIGVIFAILFILFPKKLHSPFVARPFIYLIIATVFLYTIFLTSLYQAARYFTPIVMIWEVLLNLFLIHLCSQIEFSFLKTEKQQKVARYVLQSLILILLLIYPLFAICNEFFRWGFYMV